MELHDYITQVLKDNPSPEVTFEVHVTPTKEGKILVDPSGAQLLTFTVWASHARKLAARAKEKEDV